MRNEKLKVVVEGGLMVALALVLSFIKIFSAPQGGSVTLGSMIPDNPFCPAPQSRPRCTGRNGPRVCSAHYRTLRSSPSTTCTRLYSSLWLTGDLQAFFKIGLHWVRLFGNRKICKPLHCWCNMV